MEQLLDEAKRKVDDVDVDIDADTALKKKHRDAVTEIVIGSELKLIEVWQQVAADLDKTGIRKCDLCSTGSMKWKLGQYYWVELRIWVEKGDNGKGVRVRYSVSADDQARTFYDEEWAAALKCLENWINALRSKGDRKWITTLLKQEISKWDSLLEQFPSDRIPVYSEFSFIDGRLVFEWHSEKNGCVVTLDRVPDDNEDKHGRQVCYRVSKSPNRPLEDKPEIVYAWTYHDVIVQIAEFLG